MSNESALIRRFGETLAGCKETEISAVKRTVMDKMGIGGREFDRLLGLLVADPIYFKVELVQTATKLAANGYRKRLPARQCFVNGEPVYHLSVSEDPDERVYRGFVEVKWEDVKEGDEVYIDNYVHGRYSARNKIIGPYLVASVRDRKLLYRGRPLTFREERLLKGAA